MINQIKKDLMSLKKKKLKLYVDIGRNKMEEYEGYIDNIYNRVWTFKTKKDLKCFSYNDLLIKTVIINVI